jgi:uncharacterized OB-fold protein
MSAGYPRPDPIAADEQQFWSFVAAGELRLQRCTRCGTLRHPPRPTCAACGSTTTDWVAAAGRGEVWASTVISPPTLPAFMAQTPYVAVVVRLVEGVFMVGNISDVGTDEIAIGMPVVSVITEVEPGFLLPLWRSA